ncbi:leucyl aminopeptidase [Helicobacter saguini]|uniref:Leucyl aminopeptidase n=1 Tax=Helicobacter saguini TaxID=1548018 RepID=A0A347VNT4_9HELI|nr:leucyl aminopeptidase [Helicobacter saguini]MWV61647.1 leucyl aminopeptidase [Helicobacter saguini]MWV67681.1 leucyl aminopeptidase [Helicobacter saguini]MWV70033.1 leucyl aminopeptidase [Helicobacter saguini]MWV72754.1 leucyl aminopeptidase [Helicobacter saguini]TLD92735.1 leucyl aminopeptidase [Helicobacter saguini]
MDNLNIRLAKAPSGTQILFVSKDDLGKKSIKDSKLLKELWAEAKGSFYAQNSKILYVGVKKDSKEFSDIDTYAHAAAHAARALKGLKIIESYFDFKGFDLAKTEQILQGFLLGSYEFSGYKHSKDSAEKLTATINALNLDSKILQSTQIICKNVNFVRDIVNTPPNIANSEYLSSLAQNSVVAISRKFKNADIKAVLRSNSYLEEQKMGAFLAVNQASNFPAFLAHLSYKPLEFKATSKSKAKKIPKVAIVGKGLVYDTGGLSLKPADYMTTMKADKGGACAVLGAFLSAVELGLNIELHAIMGITDNAIGKSAYRPDDILISREKKSIEVKNTDAEGRLVLADCLSYAQDLDVDYIIDFATLTGACVVALGEYTSGVMGFNEALKSQFVESALRSGELAHTLPFNSHLKKLIESKIADVSNTSSSRYGGAITAGLFLSEFIREEYKQKWLHIDIAGPAFVEKEWGVNPHGASGAGVRSCVEFLRNLK